MSDHEPPDNTHYDGGTVELPHVTVETLRAELRRRWHANDPVPAEILFPQGAERGLKLQLIFTELILRDETGRPATTADFRSRLPELADDIERQMNMLALMSGASLNGSTVGTHLPGLSPEEPASVFVPGYETVQQLGRGGMGVVYLARQVRFNRMVALKVMVAGSQAGDEDLQRFRTEAEAIARINHPGIVQVFDTGEWTPPGSATPLPYFSMEYCPDGSLAKKLNGEPQPPEEAARIARDLARAAQAVHEKGVVHRDIKPANVLLLGTTPKITDFGLAKKLDDDDSHTRPGSVMGTPSYMPPEQAAGKTRELGPLVDVYALGAVLYEMLVGQPPFKGAGLMETLDQVQNREPVAPRQLRPAVPRDLETIALKCLQKDPRKRYDSAAALADDLDRFLEGRPITARPVGALEHGWRWANRHRALTALFAVSTLAAIALIAGSFWFIGRLGVANAWAREQRFFALFTRVRERSARPKAGWTWESLKDLQEAASLADSPQRLAELRSEAAACLGTLDVRWRADLLPDEALISVAWSPDGQTVALGRRGVLAAAVLCPIYLLDPYNPDKRRELYVPAFPVINSTGNLAPDRVECLAFSPDGRWLAAGMRSGALFRVDLRAPEPKVKRLLRGLKEPVGSLAFAADGKALFASSRAESVSHDTSDWGEIGRVKNVRAAAPVPAPDGGVALAGAPTRWLDRQLREVRPAGGGEWTPECWLADGRLLLVNGGRARVSDAEGITGYDLRTLGGASAHPSGTRVYASRGGRMAVTASSSARHARLWDLCNGEMMGHLVIAGGTCRACLSPSGRSFVVVEEKGAKLFEIRERREAGVVALQAGEIQTFSLHEDGRTLVTVAPGPAGDVADFALHDLGSRAAPTRFRLPHPDPASPDFPLRLGTPGYTLTRAGRFAKEGLSVWGEQLAMFRTFTHTIPGKNLHGLGLGPQRCWAVADEWLVGWGRAGGAGPAWQNVIAGAVTGKPSLYAVAAGGSRVAVASRDGLLRVFEDAGTELKRGPSIEGSGAPLSCVAVSADGRRALAGSEHGDVLLFDLESGTVLARRPAAHGDEVTGVAFQPDGVLVTGSADRLIRLWVAEGSELREVAGLRHPEAVRRLELSPDGVTLYALLEHEHGVRTWHLGRLFEQFRNLGLGDGVPAVSARPLNGPPFAVEALPTTPSGPGLRAELYQWPHFLIPWKSRVDPRIDFDTPAGSPFSARWTGWLKVPSRGKYTIRLSGSKCLRLWLDGEKRIDLWPDATASEFAFETHLTEGPHELRVEVSVPVGPSHPRLTWSQAGGFPEQVIGPPHLFTDREAALKAK